MSVSRPSSCCTFFFSSRRRHTRWNCDWSSDVCSSDLVGRHEPDQHGGEPHGDDGDEEGVLAADEIADAAEDQRPEGADEEARRVRAERAEQRGRLVPRREEQGGEERRQDGVQVEVVPLEHRADRGSDDDTPLFRAADHPVAGGVHRCGDCTHVDPLSAWVLSEGKGCPLSEVHGCGVSTLQIKTHYVSARAGHAEPTWQDSESKGQTGRRSCLQLCRSMPLQSGLPWTVELTGCEQLL